VSNVIPQTLNNLTSGPSEFGHEISVCAERDQHDTTVVMAADGKDIVLTIAEARRMGRLLEKVARKAGGK